jgi:2-(1,2-epoxy-1,2-dihydrophenyl)acetyl-CoA isomerase
MLRQSSDGALRILTLDRPEQRNALNLPLLKALRAALAAAAGERVVRALILTGAGKGFCAGADIAEWAEAEAAGRLETYGWTDESHALVGELFDFPKPTVAQLNGAAVGAGLDLALACDFRFASDAARFSCAYTRMAYPPDAGGSWLLPRLIGLAAAKRFVYTGEFWSANEAKTAGLVSEIHPAESLPAATIDFARRLAAGPTVAIAEAKRLLQSASTRDLRAQLVAEHDAGLRCGRSEDAREALAAAVGRREPVFKGV